MVNWCERPRRFSLGAAAVAVRSELEDIFTLTEQQKQQRWVFFPARDDWILTRASTYARVDFNTTQMPVEPRQLVRVR